MQIVIELPEDQYKAIVEKHNTFPKEMKEWGLDAIKNGTVLPMGHGRLIDADALEKKMCDREEELGDDRALWESSAVSVALDMFAPTIIEADNKYEAKVINRGNCMMCGKELTEGLFFCKECEDKESEE